MHRLRLIALVLFAALCSSVRADEPFLKKDDVIALVGGEDMVAASEYGYLELLLTRALPDYHLKFRNLAWEGDTVFEQPRQLNFPTWEQQLDKIGATVVICQFGQMESLAGKGKLPEFIAAYGKLLDRFSGGGERRIVVLEPLQFGQPTDTLDYADAIKRTFGDSVPGVLPPGTTANHFQIIPAFDLATIDAPVQRDGVHLTRHGHFGAALEIGSHLHVSDAMDLIRGDKAEPLRQLIIAKNRLWFDYWRPQNWAFLNGDRITQPSSRDHRDPNIRWFPAEMEQFLPLIAAKEEAIWKLAVELK